MMLNQQFTPRAGVRSDPRATRELRFLFFDVHVAIRSDSSEFLALFEKIFPRFRCAGLPPSPESSLEVTLLVKPADEWRSPTLLINGQPHGLNAALPLEGYLYDLIQNAILALVRSHFLIHAGVVSLRNQGVLLAADSGHGKTTLVLSLVRRGLQFLSDELAPLSRTDRRVYPFPRSLRVRPGSLELAGYPAAPPGAPLWFGKLLMDVEELQPGSLGEAAEINHVVILKSPDAEPVGGGGVAQKELGIFVDFLDESLLEATRRLEGVSQAWQTVELGYPVLRLIAAQRMSVLRRVEELCQERGILILDVSKRALRPARFDQPARMEAIPKSQAVMELLRQFQPGHKSELLRDNLAGSATRLFMELATTIENAQCHQLTTGPLAEMTDLVCDLLEPG